MSLNRLVPLQAVGGCVAPAWTDPTLTHWRGFKSPSARFTRCDGVAGKSLILLAHGSRHGFRTIMMLPYDPLGQWEHNNENTTRPDLGNFCSGSGAADRGPCAITDHQLLHHRRNRPGCE